MQITLGGLVLCRVGELIDGGLCVLAELKFQNMRNNDRILLIRFALRKDLPRYILSRVKGFHLLNR